MKKAYVAPRAGVEHFLLDESVSSSVSIGGVNTSSGGVSEEDVLVKGQANTDDMWTKSVSDGTEWELPF